MRRGYPRRGRDPPERRLDGRPGRRSGAGCWRRRARPPSSRGASSRTSGTVIHAPDETLQLAVLCLLADGHLIIEDFPGVGKTTLAKALARSVDCSFSRLQFTPDLLPSDVTGVNVFNQRSNEFEFRPGPVFANILLVDEINRASPKTQAALLECMQEHQVTVDGVSYQLAAAVHGHGDAEPDRVRGHLSAARGRARPLHDAHRDRLPAARRRGADAVRADDATSRSTRSSRWRPHEELLGAIEDARRRLRRGEPQPLRRRAAAAHAHGQPPLPRRQPAGGDRAAARREGAGARRGPRLRRPRRRQGGRAGRARAPADPRARGALVGLDAEELVRDVVEHTPVPV